MTDHPNCVFCKVAKDLHLADTPSCQLSLETPSLHDTVFVVDAVHPLLIVPAAEVNARAPPA